MDRLLPTVLITGASCGIGKELARVFAENHYSLILVARDRVRLEALAQELHHLYLVPIRVEVCDLSRRDDVEALISRIQSEHVVVDVLVNNAGVGVEGAFTTTDWTRERDMIELNVSALVRLTKAFLPQMVNRRAGKILQIASTAAFQPGPYLSVYFATKAFVLSFSEAIATELRGSGVTVTAFCPGPTHTEFERRLGTDSGLFASGLPVANVRSVAEHAFAAVMRGKRVGIHGLLNRILAVLVGWSPNAFTLFLLGRALNKKPRSRSGQAKDFSSS